MLRAGLWLADPTAGQINSACSYFLIGLRPDSVGGQQSHKTQDKNNLLRKEIHGPGQRFDKRPDMACIRGDV